MSVYLHNSFDHSLNRAVEVNTQWKHLVGSAAFIGNFKVVLHREPNLISFDFSPRYFLQSTWEWHESQVINLYKRREIWKENRNCKYSGGQMKKGYLGSVIGL